MRIGLISDTHGLVRPEVFHAFSGVDHILHAGDVGSDDVLLELEAIAPVTAVWGNTDGWDLRHRLPEVAFLTLDGHDVKVIHGQQYGTPRAAVVAADSVGAALVVFGHSHQPEILRTHSTIAVNPGSAGPVRFKLPITVAVAMTTKDEISVQLVTLVTR